MAVPAALRMIASAGAAIRDEMADLRESRQFDALPRTRPAFRQKRMPLWPDTSAE
jgi:hypothetical protein